MRANPLTPFGRDPHHEQAVIERRRRQEAERKDRFLNEKLRTKGIDTEAIERQLAEKRALKEREEQKNNDYLKYLHATDALLQNLEDQKQHMLKERVDRDFELNAWMKANPQARREFYLNDPHALKHGRPARTSDNDPACGVSSLQIFQGEDLERHVRVHHQQQELRNDISATLKARDHQRDQQQKMAQQEAEYLKLMDQHLQAQEDHKNDIQKSINDNLTRFNQQLQAQGKPQLVHDKFLPTEDFFSQFSTGSR